MPFLKYFNYNIFFFLNLKSDISWDGYSREYILGIRNQHSDHGEFFFFSGVITCQFLGQKPNADDKNYISKWGSREDKSL